MRQFIVGLPTSIHTSKVHNAVLDGDLDSVRKFLDCREYVTQMRNPHGFTLLHLAVISNSPEIFDYLLTRNDTDINARCHSGRTPLYYAALLGHRRSVERLCLAGADFNLPDAKGYVPLHASVTHPELCHLLIRRGARPDAVSNGDCTPLHKAVEHGSDEAVHLLLYHGAHPNVPDRTGFTPFMTALNCGNFEAQRVLLDYVDDFNRSSWDISYPVTTLNLAFHGRSPFIGEIITRGADVNYGDRPEVSGCHAAFSMGLRYVEDVETFGKLWERLRYNEGKNTIDLIGFLGCIGGVVRKFLPVILQSKNFQPVVRFLSKRENYRRFVDKFAELKFDPDQLTVLTCRMLQAGFRPTNFDIYAVFRSYGWCELFRILLYADRDFGGCWLPRMAFCRTLCDVGYDLGEAAACLGDFDRGELVEWARYHFIPRSVVDGWREDGEKRGVLEGLPKVPSLTELSRNAARTFVRDVLGARTSCWFYTVVDGLPVTSVCKEMLRLERPLYFVGI